MATLQILEPQVIENSFVFKLHSDPGVRHIVPLRLRDVVERAANGEPASKIFLSQKREDKVQLHEIRWVFEKIGRAALDQKGETQSLSFKKNWFDFEVFGFKLTSEISFFQSQPAAFLLVIFMVIASLLGPGGLLRLYEYAGFLQWKSSFAGSLWWLMIALTLIGLTKGFFLLVLSGLLTGKILPSRLVYRGLMLDLAVDATRIEASVDKNDRVLYWMGSAYSALAAAGVLSWFATLEQVRDLKLLALLLTLVSVNPSRLGEVSRIFAALFVEGSSRRLVPFLKNRGLFFVLSRNAKQEGEEKFLLYSAISLAWSFCFLLVAQNILNSNYGEWWLRLQSAETGEKATVLLIAGLVALLLLSLLYDLAATLSRNLLYPLLGARLKSGQKRNIKSLSSYNSEKLLSLLSDIPFFQGLSEKALKEIVNKSQVRRVPARTRMIVQGDEGREVFALLEGEAEVLRRDPMGLEEHLAELRPGALFGEIALLREVKRTADVVAIQDSIVLVLGKDEFKALVSSESSAQVLEQRAALSTFFADCPVFHKLPQETLQLFLEKGEFIQAARGTQVIREGSDDQNFYLLVRGKALVESKTGLRAELETGGFFGEIALFERRARTANVKVTEDSLLLKLSRDAFWTVVDSNLGMAVDIESVSDARLGGTL